MKRSIEWHERNLKNSEHSLEEKRKQLESYVLHFARHSENVEFLRLQIQEAKHLNKNGFDENKFMKNRRG